MSNLNPYEQLGVTESSSFDEIQAARTRLCAEHQGDRKQLETIEAAYDAVLMDRLRLRQEGKIKVPDRIRFPEKLVAPPPEPVSSPARETPDWLKRLLDSPSPQDIWLPALIMAILSGLVLYQPTSDILQLALILGVGSSLYFLFRKERKLGRTVLLGFSGLVLGFVLGGLLSALLKTQLTQVGLEPTVFTTIGTFIVLWLISSFLR
jgi:hypothetical protein